MKFLVEKKTIFKSLSHLQSIVDKRNALPILSNILIEVKNNELVNVFNRYGYFYQRNCYL